MPSYPRGFTPRPSNPVTMTQVYNHNANTPQIMGSIAGQAAGAFASVRSLASLAVVQRQMTPATVGGVEAYISTLYVKGSS